ncbi:MAG: hypothetical protein Q4C89_11035 [Deinococcus sp.]|uniref:sigma-70 region 4 domain-containing protein n=1 Tax=Deinococcus sp. TaxID=47478 RepID=UPI0026DB3200|nr:hypothetical protein [Deinococcus sp.]MDO4246548.1 hypothetical protein [Deinococcus sp.]
MMPVKSEQRQVLLFSAQEISEIFDIPLRTLRRHITQAREKGTLYEERVPSRGRGAPGLYMDAMTLGLALNPDRIGTQFPGSSDGTQFENSVPELSATTGIECQSGSGATQPQKPRLQHCHPPGIQCHKSWHPIPELSATQISQKS